MKYLPDYTLINQKATGARLKSAIRESGYRVSEIQQFLSFSGPQPIYRWFRGEALPSLHHLYALSDLLDVPIDSLLVRGQDCTANEDLCDELLWIDLDRAGKDRCAPGMYGIALLARRYTKKRCPEPESNQ